MAAQRPSLSIEALAARGSIASEHVVLASSDVAELERVRSNVVRFRITLRNRARATETLVTIFKDGYLGVTERRRGGIARRVDVDLRFVNPCPRLSRHRAWRTLRVAAASLAAASLGAVLAYLSVWPQITLAFAAAALAAAASAALVYVRRSYERVDFRTRHGQAVVLMLTANIGCVRAHRRAIPKLVAAIRESHRKAGTDRHALLREEMAEHYRLAAAGLLSAPACSAATRRILSKF